MPIFEGNSIQAAITKGLAVLKLPRDEVNVEVITEGKRGLFGIGRKPAVVNLKPNLPASPTTPTVTTIKAASPAVVTKPKVIKPKATKRNDLQTATDHIVAYLEAITAALSIPTQIKVTAEKDNLVFHLQTAREGFLIGKHGQKINALQYLAQTAFNHYTHLKKRIILNVGDYRQRRTAILKKVADNAAREVIATGRPYTLDPMPSFERKQIHQRLQDNQYVTTHSEGVEPHRYVVVSLHTK
ncbi:MAG: protein jag [Candidatus Paralactobacillus gallistercoris]|uniref:RNA-binding protein KhpB n=1 Tax=Candidatus Paralactobacillus gallistercoris TaxID=2838724 RepID=A0A948TIE6_9LACO|nr:protein jag [Candidatus Paralactobacillus gallistercoris]